MRLYTDFYRFDAFCVFRFIMDRLDMHRDNWREVELLIDLGTELPLTEEVNLKVIAHIFKVDLCLIYVINYCDRIKELLIRHMGKKMQMLNLPKKKILIYQKGQQIRFSDFVRNKGRLYSIK